MAKITLREYQTRYRELNEELANVRTMLECLNASAEDGTLTIDPAVTELWNGMHDDQRRISDELRDLDRDWRTRNWTSADWSSWELVCSNTD